LYTNNKNDVNSRPRIKSDFYNINRRDDQLNMLERKRMNCICQR